MAYMCLLQYQFMYIRIVFIVSVVVPWLQLLKLCVCYYIYQLALQNYTAHMNWISSMKLTI